MLGLRELELHLDPDMLKWRSVESHVGRKSLFMPFKVEQVTVRFGEIFTLVCYRCPCKNVSIKIATRNWSVQLGTNAIFLFAGYAQLSCWQL